MGGAYSTHDTRLTF